MQPHTHSPPSLLSPTTHPHSLLTLAGGHPVRLVADTRGCRAQLRAPRGDPRRRGDSHGHAVSGARRRTDRATGQRRRYAVGGGGGAAASIFSQLSDIFFHVYSTFTNSMVATLLIFCTHPLLIFVLSLSMCLWTTDYSVSTDTPLQSASARVSCSSRTTCARCAACGMTANALSE